MEAGGSGEVIAVEVVVYGEEEIADRVWNGKAESIASSARSFLSSGGGYHRLERSGPSAVRGPRQLCALGRSTVETTMVAGGGAELR